MTPLFLLFPYICLLAICIISLRRQQGRQAVRSDEARSAESRPLTVVICVSHETRQELTRCLDSLRVAVGASARAADQVVVAFDGAPQESVAHVMAMLSSFPCKTRTVGHQERQGKKRAQRKAVSLADNADVVSIDADCSVSGHFFTSVRRGLPEGEYMLLLPVAMRGDGRALGRMEELEFTCLQVVTAGTASVGRPSMANGAGMVFSKRLYEEHDSHLEYASGDDMFLLEHAARIGARVAFLSDPDSLVETSAPATLGGYVRQRARWLSKTGGYGGVGAVHVVALATLMGNMSWPVGIVLSAMGLSSWWMTTAAFVLKLIADMACYVAGKGLWRSGVSLLWALPLEVLYPLMIAVVGMKTVRSPKGSW